jgi:SAM-dependent methyltransferase
MAEQTSGQPETSTLWSDGTCTVCGGSSLVDLLAIETIPAQDGVLWASYDEAIAAPQGEVHLQMCLRCSYIGNSAFEPDLLRFTEYNVSPEFSAQYRGFIEDLGEQLIDRHDVRSCDVVDLGCGNGFFLKMMCSMGGNRGVGFDPSYSEVEAHSFGDEALGATFIRDYFSEKYLDHRSDLVCCRQVLDHLGDPMGFLRLARRIMRPDSVAYFEVVNAEKRLGQFAPWSIGYEHASWFLPDSLALFFQLTGFEVLDVSSWHSGNYLGIEARRTESRSPRVRFPRDVSDVQRRFSGIPQRFAQVTDEWSRRLAEMERLGRRALPWGAGELGIGFLNTMDIRQSMPYIVDINPARIGKYLPGTGQRVVAPEFIVEYEPEVVIVTNPIYEVEIREQIRAYGVDPEILVL